MLAGFDERMVYAILSLGLLLAALAVARRMRGGHQPLRVFHLGQGHRVHLLEVEGRRLLVGTGPGGVPQLLTEIGPSPQVSDGP